MQGLRWRPGDRIVQLATMLRTTENKLYRQNIQDPGELAEGFPTRPEGLFGYRAIIIGSIEATYFTPTQRELIRSGFQKIAVYIVMAPIIGLLLAFTVMTGVYGAVHRYQKVERLNRGFRRGQLVTSAAMSLGHGTNDAQKTMGVILVLLIATHHLQAKIGADPRQLTILGQRGGGQHDQLGQLRAPQSRDEPLQRRSSAKRC